MHVRQLAWYGATPGKAKQSRAETAKAEGTPLNYPPPGDAAYLLDYLFEVGPVGWAGMGEVPVSHLELQAWQANTGTQLQAWEARALRRLSQAYVNQVVCSREANCPAPWAPEVPDETRRDSVDRKLRSIFSALAANGPKQQPRNKGLKPHARRRH